MCLESFSNDLVIFGAYECLTLAYLPSFFWGEGMFLFCILFHLSIIVLCMYFCLESAERTASIVRSMKSDALAYQCDCRNEAEVASMAKRVSKEIGPVDILVNNAGILHGKSFLTLNTDEIRKTFDVNVLAHFWVCWFSNSCYYLLLLFVCHSYYYYCLLLL